MKSFTLITTLLAAATSFAFASAISSAPESLNVPGKVQTLLYGTVLS